MGKLLTELGDGYRYEEITETQILRKEKKLPDYDVLFLRPVAGGGKEPRKPARQLRQRRRHPLRLRLAAHEAVSKAFPDLSDSRLQAEGKAQELDADIVDPALREVLGASKIHLKFDLPEWKTAAFSGPRVKTLIKGEFAKYKSDKTATAPLMVKFNIGKGTVIFTSFHNEKPE